MSHADNPTSVRQLLPHEATRLLEASGVRVAVEQLMPLDVTVGDVTRLDLRYPAAIKVASAAIAHKAKVGGVVLGCHDPDAVVAATRRIEANIRANFPDQFVSVQGVYVQEMVAGDLEVLLGLQNDPDFGLLVAFGLGGWAVEAWEDLAFRRPPLSAAGIDGLFGATRAGALLLTHSDRFTRAIDDIRTAIEGLSRLALESNGSLLELEANPLIVGADGAVAVDGVGLVIDSPDTGGSFDVPWTILERGEQQHA